MFSFLLSGVLLTVEPPPPPCPGSYLEEAVCGTARVVVAAPVETGRFAVRTVSRTVEWSGDLFYSTGRWFKGIGRDLRDGGRRLRHSP